jgi:hypothetical protein
MTSDGVWLAYYSDWSGMAVFESELECLRYAVDKTMTVKYVPFGQDLRDAVRLPGVMQHG